MDDMFSTPLAELLYGQLFGSVGFILLGDITELPANRTF